MLSGNTTNNNLSQSKDIFSMIQYDFETDIKNVAIREVRSGFIVQAGINLYVASAGSGKTLLMHCLAIDFMKSVGNLVVYVDLIILLTCLFQEVLLKLLNTII